MMPWRKLPAVGLVKLINLDDQWASLYLYNDWTSLSLSRIHLAPYLGGHRLIAIDLYSVQDDVFGGVTDKHGIISGTIAGADSGIRVS